MATIEKRGDKYRVKLRIRGTSRTGTFTSIADAKEWIKITEADVLRDIYLPHKSSTAAITLAELIDRYEAEVLPNRAKNTQAMYQIFLRVAREHIGHFPISQIDSKTMMSYQSKLFKLGKCPSTVNRYIAVVLSVINKAMDWDIIDTSPVKRLKKLEEGRNKSTRYLNKQEITTLLQHAKLSRNRHMYLIVLLALNTGMRKNEIRFLKWNDIDFDNNMILLKQTKNGHERAVPIVQSVIAALKDHMKNRYSVYVFPNASGSKPTAFMGSWVLMKARLPFSDFRFHDLRHTAASHLTMAGVPLITVADILGHKTLEMTKRYSHLSNQHKLEAVEKLSKFMQS